MNFAKSLENKVPDRWLEWFKPQRQAGMVFEERRFTDSRQPNIYYKIDTSDFYQLDSGFLNNLSKTGREGDDAMDTMHIRNLSRFRRDRRQING